MNESDQPTWKNPIAKWEPGTSVDNVSIEDWSDPLEPWRENRAYKVKLHRIGHFRYYWKFRAHGRRLWHRTRWWPTRRRILLLRGGYNPKTLRGEKSISDKRPLYWIAAFAMMLIFPFLVPSNLTNTLLSAAAVFAIYAAINLCWMLVIGTAGIYSLATYSVVGAAAYGTAYLSIQFGMPWWSLPFFGTFIGLAFGVLIAIPALRLDGFYYALLTLGLNELCRVYVLQSRTFGSATGGLYGAETYVPEHLSSEHQLMLGYYAAVIVMLCALAIYRLVDGRRLGRLLRMAPEKKEAFAAACGVNYRRARIQVFLISSTALGAIGGFYAAHFRGASPSLFGIELVSLGLAMLVIGGMRRAEGVVLGTLIVVLLRDGLITWGPIRLILIGVIMLAAVLFLRGGLFGIKPQFRAWRDKKKVRTVQLEPRKEAKCCPKNRLNVRIKITSTSDASTRCSVTTLRPWLATRSSMNINANRSASTVKRLNGYCCTFDARRSVISTLSKLSSRSRTTALLRCPAIAELRRVTSRKKPTQVRLRRITVCSCAAYKTCSKHNQYIRPYGPNKNIRLQR